MTKPAPDTVPSKLMAENRQARHHYFIEDTFEAGIKLMGWEVKAIRAGQANFNGGNAFVRVQDGGAFLDALTITPLASSNKGLLLECVPTRLRTLLLNKAELRKIERRVLERGYTLVPLAIELNSRGLLKLRVGLAKGKKLADKRATLKERDLSRETARQLRDC